MHYLFIAIIDGQLTKEKRAVLCVGWLEAAQTQSMSWPWTGEVERVEPGRTDSTSCL